MVEKDKTLQVYTNREGRISSYTMPNREVMCWEDVILHEQTREEPTLYWSQNTPKKQGVS
jgi:hypothetical protein